MLKSVKKTISVKGNSLLLLFRTRCATCYNISNHVSFNTRHFLFYVYQRYFFLFYFHDQGNLIRYMLYIFPFFLPFHLTAFLCSQTLSFSGSHFLVFFPLRPVSPFSHSHSGVSKVMAPNSSTLAWQIPWAEEPGRLQSMGSLRVGHD